MNPKYYVTPEELKEVVEFLNDPKFMIGGGVKAVVGNLFAGPFSVPEVPGKAMLGVMLNSGVEMNAGLTYDLLHKGYDIQWVAQMLRAMATPSPLPDR
jgi:hypothetical protein